jgi:DNA topoisomerase-1
VDDDGTTHPIDSADVNDYIREIAGEAFTAKDFRTWVGTVNCAMILAQSDAAETAAERKQRVADAIKEVANRLGNTPTVCRKCYVHPEIITAYSDEGTLKMVTTVKARGGLLPEERFVISLLRKRAKEGLEGRTMRQLKRSIRARKGQAA